MTDEELIEQAISARTNAYAPYSKYRVGAALVGKAKNGNRESFLGSNVENASYGATICAERVAITNAVHQGLREVEVIAIATSNSPPASPCGICRQVLREFSSAPDKLRIIMVNENHERQDSTLADLLPLSFAGDQLSK